MTAADEPASPVRLRPVDREPLDAVLNLRCADGQEANTNDYTWALLQAAYWYGGAAKMYAVCAGDTVVGRIRLDDTPDCHSFTDLLIDRAHQRRGYAEAAVREAVRLFRCGGKHSRVSIFVAEDNAAAIALYRKCGFTETGRCDPDVPQLREYALALAD
ncbi:MAG: GNAT family N-acetyltransferase [Oscillospiraceae bacterium]|jgi:ribosomal protein S18 acetylase RimI-like enzyme|nr:GNAT family N-acetyltransferase [Oscillospiraceae bacterium]